MTRIHRSLLLRSVVIATLSSALSIAPKLAAQPPNPTPAAIGEKLTDGQAYVTLVRLEHQPDASQNGRILIALEENGMKGIPIYESTDEGATWHFAVHAVDTTQQDTAGAIFIGSRTWRRFRAPSVRSPPEPSCSRPARSATTSAVAWLGCSSNSGAPPMPEEPGSFAEPWPWHGRTPGMGTEPSDFG